MDIDNPLVGLTLIALGFVPLIVAIVYRKKLERFLNSLLIGSSTENPQLDELADRVVEEVAEELQHKANLRKARRDAEIRAAQGGPNDDARF